MNIMSPLLLILADGNDIVQQVPVSQWQSVNFVGPRPYALAEGDKVVQSLLQIPQWNSLDPIDTRLLILVKEKSIVQSTPAAQSMVVCESCKSQAAYISRGESVCCGDRAAGLVLDIVSYILVPNAADASTMILTVEILFVAPIYLRSECAGTINFRDHPTIFTTESL